MDKILGNKYTGQIGQTSDGMKVVGVGSQNCVCVKGHTDRGERGTFRNM